MAFTKRDIDAARAAREARTSTVDDSALRHCPRCGSTTDDSARFCHACGATLSEEAHDSPESSNDRLTESDRTRIYEEEKTRLEARHKVKAQHFMRGFWVLLVLIAVGYWVQQRDAYQKMHAAPQLGVTAEKLYADYQTNEISADVQYKGKIIEISGTVSDVGRDILNHIYIAFSTGKPLTITSVQAFFDDAYMTRIGQVQKGQFFRAKCRCDGKFANVLLRDCVPY
jgi:hypothetical protein